MPMTPPTLIRKQAPDGSHSVTVWRQGGQYNGQPAVTYLKVWEGLPGESAAGWLSWGLHENFLLTLLAGRGVRSAVTTLGLNKDTHRIELSTLDAGPELQRDWLDAGAPILSDVELVKLGCHTLQALVQIHREGVVHGDLKTDNICIDAVADPRTGARCVDWRSLKLIDFAFSLSRDYPLRFVLPTDTRKIDYLPGFYKRAIEKSQRAKAPELAQAACSAAIDLFSLGVMLQKLAATSGRPCPGATTLAQACLKAGSRRAPWRWPWADARFEAPTLRLEQAALQWLRAQGLGDDAIGRSAPMEASAPGSVMPTPLRAQAQATPLAALPPTPLLPRTPLAPTPLAPAPGPATEPVPGPESTSAPSPEPGPSPPSPARVSLWARVHWIGVTLLLALCFALIDQAYLATRLRLSDAGYMAALLAIACAAPLVVAALWQARRPARGAEWVCLVTALVLAVAALFHAVSLLQAGLGWLAAVQLAAPWLLAVAMAARRAAADGALAPARA